MKLRMDWKAGVMPAVRTAGALISGNSVVWFALDSTKVSAALTMAVVGFIIILLTSLKGANDV